jgi:hypothetical protein
MIMPFLACLPLEVQDFFMTPVIAEKPQKIVTSIMESRRRSRQ